MIFLYSHWLSLPLSLRAKIAERFGIKKGPTHVSNNVVVDDGYKVKDIEAIITAKTMQDFTGLVTDDLQILWQAMVDKIDGVKIKWVLF